MKSLFKHITVSIITLEAKILLRRKRPTIVAVTGSVGKTSTKDAIYEAIKGTVSARKSQKTYNSDIGVPLSILGLPSGWSNPLAWIKNMIDGVFIALFAREYPQVLVLETGIDRPGDMQALTSWLKPHYVVLTRFPDVPVHVEFFDTPEQVIREKMRLVEALDAEGTVIYNQDDEIIRREVDDLLQTTVGYSRYSQSQFTVTGDTVVYENNRPVGVSFTLAHGDKQVPVELRGALGVQHAYNVAAAAAVAAQFGVALEATAAAMEHYTPPAGRMRILEGLKNTLIIDDSYNSSPVAVERALQTLKELNCQGRKIAVLGDMLELGHFSVQEHERVGEQVAQSADLLITVGVRSRKTAQAALAHGFPESNVLQYDDVLRAGKELQNLMTDGDLILVKGSQSIRTERVVKEIMQEPERAHELLVRQETVWEQK